MNEHEQNTLKFEAELVNDGFIDMSKLVSNAFDLIIKKIKTPEAITGITTCFPSLDHYTSGLQRGDLIVVAGRPSMGERYFVRDIAMHIALVHDLPVAILDAEKSGEYQAMRIIASMAKMDYTLLHHCQISNDESDLLKSSFAFLNDAQIYFASLIPATLHELGQKLRKLNQRTGGLGLVVVDCLPELKLLDEKMNSDYAIKITHTSRYLKALAQELDVPIIVLSPIEREIEDRCNKCPQLTDLPGMAAIANAADLVLMVYRDEVYDPDTEEKGLANIIVSRNSNGYIGGFQLKFDKRYGIFEEK
ncbi:DnaB-like helicase C-terminal domain-containing protein [Methylotenera sp.]|uniref:replicative DNA helicase n=1 Tax=Methylotenera sp. TaxID=2051956 RepID=UPI002731AF84|nr:DnaB-like helicase C-terminal domain-containing protein [Methylotenera sp.]MDP2231774.1 DnaB-like helicase C-terminal domain-containing protein [Methylotenera sp.]